MNPGAVSEAGRNVLFLSVLLLLLSSVSSSADVGPELVCQEIFSNSDSWECSIDTPENFNETVETVRWSVEEGNLTEGNESVEVDAGGGEAFLGAQVSMGDDIYNLSKPLNSSAEEKADRSSGDARKDNRIKKPIGTGNFTDKNGDGSNVERRNETSPERRLQSSYLANVSVSCPDRVNISESFVCSVDVAVNSSLEMEDTWFSDAAELVDQEEYRAEFRAERQGSMIVGYRLNNSEVEIVSTEKVVVTDPGSVEKPVEKPERNERIRELNKTIRRKNQTIESLRTKVERLEEKLNETKSDEGVTENRTENVENSSEAEPVNPMPGNSTGGNQPEDSNLSDGKNKSADRGPVGRDEGGRSGSSIVEIISSLFT